MVKLNSKGQVTIPADLRHRHGLTRHRHGLTEGDELDVVEQDGVLCIVHRTPVQTRGARLVHRMRGQATTEMSTDELMELLRGD